MTRFLADASHFKWTGRSGYASFGQDIGSPTGLVETRGCRFNGDLALLHMDSGGEWEAERRSELPPSEFKRTSCIRHHSQMSTQVQTSPSLRHRNGEHFRSYWVEDTP